MHAGLPHHPVANVLPVRPFNQALLGPFAEHTGVSWHSLAVLAAWGAAGTLVAIWRFRWAPGRSDPPVQSSAGPAQLPVHCWLACTRRTPSAKRFVLLFW